MQPNFSALSVESAVTQIANNPNDQHLKIDMYGVKAVPGKDTRSIRAQVNELITVIENTRFDANSDIVKFRNSLETLKQIKSSDPSFDELIQAFDRKTEGLSEAKRAFKAIKGEDNSPKEKTEKLLSMVKKFPEYVLDKLAGLEDLSDEQKFEVVKAAAQNYSPDKLADLMRRASYIPMDGDRQEALIRANLRGDNQKGVIKSTDFEKIHADRLKPLLLDVVTSQGEGMLLAGESGPLGDLRPQDRADVIVKALNHLPTPISNHKKMEIRDKVGKVALFDAEGKEKVQKALSQL